MSAPWYAVTDPRPETAWELYHENSKRGPQDGIAVRRKAGTPPDYSGLPMLPLAERAPLQPHAAPVASGGGSLSLRTFSDLLAAGCCRLSEVDPVSAFVAIVAVESLPRGLGWYDPAHHNLRVVRREDTFAQVHKVLVSPEILSRSAALILLAADFDAATAALGERGYRDALIAGGRHLAMIETAAAAASLNIETVGFHDRAVDALLALDGLSRSVIAAVAMSA